MSQRTKHELDEWHALRPEEILEPEQRICDPHHHLWDHATHRYLLEELWQDTGSGHRVERTVFVECMSEYRDSGPESHQPVGETEFVAAAAEASDRDPTAASILGIVSYADLTLGDDVTEVLEAHVEAGLGRFRGIRHAAGFDVSNEVRNSHTHPPSGLLASDDFRTGFARLSPLGLSFDAWLYHHQIDELTELAQAFPETPIVLDHFGGPLGIGPYAGRADEVHSGWLRSMQELAKCDNVRVKIGGLAMPINGFEWHKRDQPPSSRELADATSRYYLDTIDLFGPDRCMFESNFPVDRVSCSYAVLWNSFKHLAADFSAEEKDDLFYGTASRFYRLDPARSEEDSA